MSSVTNLIYSEQILSQNSYGNALKSNDARKIFLNCFVNRSSQVRERGSQEQFELFKRFFLSPKNASSTSFVKTPRLAFIIKHFTPVINNNVLTRAKLRPSSRVKVRAKVRPGPVLRQGTLTGDDGTVR
jgi:hypothetical protein